MFLGIDPGLQKFGWALTQENGALQASGVAPFEELDAFISAVVASPDALSRWKIEGSLPAGIRIRRVFCGNGIGHALFLCALVQQNVEVELAEERNTTLDARGLYWELHPPRGLWRLVPLSLRVPPRPVDDLAACCIVRRSLHI
ncbi:MAG: endonuclease [Pyramidobacter sp.]|nr:endonuclease [Pyramidobacter sp.]